MNKVYLSFPWIPRSKSGTGFGQAWDDVLVSCSSRIQFNVSSIIQPTLIMTLVMLFLCLFKKSYYVEDVVPGLTWDPGEVEINFLNQNLSNNLASSKVHLCKKFHDIASWNFPWIPGQAWDDVVEGRSFLLQANVLLATLLFPMVLSGTFNATDVTVPPPNAVASTQTPTDLAALVQDLQAVLHDTQAVQKVATKLPDQMPSGFIVPDIPDDQTEQAPQPLSQIPFYADYVAVYYPKAFVMCNTYFENKSVNAVVDGLNVVIEVMAEDPWFYFTNKPQGFVVAHYWEYILDQLSILSDFIHRAYVYQDTLTVCLPSKQNNMALYTTGLVHDGQTQRKSRRFITSLTREQLVVVHNFYALCYDYLIKLFNEQIIAQTPQSCKTANRLYAELSWIVEQLRKSGHEARYQEHLQTARQLLELLKNKINARRPAMMGGYGHGAAAA